MKINEIAGGKVWIITYQDYDDVRILGVFTSKAAGEKAKNNMNLKSGDYPGAETITAKNVHLKEFNVNKIYTDWAEQSLS